MELKHDSAEKHVTGEAVFINDMDVHSETLFGYVYYSRVAHSKIKSYDLDEAKKSNGVYAILSAKDIPGENQVGPVFKDELCIAEDEVTFQGQAIFLIASDTRENAIEASKKIKIEFEKLDEILTLEKAIEKNTIILGERKIEKGDLEKGFSESDNIIEGIVKTGAQEHWYLETQTALVVPTEGGEYKVYSSSQNPSETQIIVAEVLGISFNKVEVEVRRIGGGFGGKETQANHSAAWAAILAYHTKKPVKIHLFRDDDQIMTGKRHRYLSKYRAGFDNDGILKSVDIELNADAGAATDLSMAILERATLHSDNSYFIPNIRIRGRAFKTNLPSNTAFRGFGGPQGIAVIETIIDEIARKLGKDSAEIRKINFYQKDKNNIAPYGEKILNNHLDEIYSQILESSDYINRKAHIKKYNDENEFYKKGIALMPVKFGISFTTSFLNQAGALVNIYKDGTVLVNHGGTEMGQGLNTKMQIVAAKELGISPEKIFVNPTNTSKIPNTSATAASSGSDLNGMAIKNAIEKIKRRLTEFVPQLFSKKFPGKNFYGNIIFKDNFVFYENEPDKKIPFSEIIPEAVLGQISMSATGYYRTPGIFFDREKGQGNPFYYYTYGIAVSEVLVDMLTGYVKILRVDILQDVGESIEEGIDMGQIFGGFVQGIGWVTTEEIKWDKDGGLWNHSPDTYKIPTINDIPIEFRVNLLKNVPHPGTIHRSKAIGEPPFMLALSVWFAIKDAIAATGKKSDINLPATNEEIILAVSR